MTVIDEARSLIENRLRIIEDEVDRLRRALPHLAEGSAPRRPRSTAGSGSGRRATKSRGGGKRAPKGARRGQFLQAVADAGPDGVSVSQIAKKLNIVPQPLYAIGKDLERARAVTKDGSLYKPVGSTPKADKPPRAAKASKRQQAGAKAKHQKATEGPAGP